MDTGLAGRTVLITGASRNMGRVAALAFAAEGANLALCTSTRIVEQDAIADEARALGVSVLSVRCDITDPVAVADFVGRVADAFGTVDVAVNVAGYRAEAAFLEETLENWNRTIAVNMNGPFHVCRSVLPLMMARRWGRIINFSGLVPFIGGTPAKAMVKFGIVGLTRGLAKEFGPHGITANCIGPGAIARETDTPDTARRLPFAIPMGRKGMADEVVSAAVYLASEKAGFITGQCYLVNGGAHFI